jgi:transposase
LNEEQQAELKAAIQEPPEKVGLGLANWNWKVVREFIRRRFSLELSRNTCLNYLHRLGFVLKRPKKRLVKANAEQRAAFVELYATVRAEAEVSGAKILFVDEAHFRADADLRQKWVLRGQPALVDSTSPRLGEKINSYSAVCVESGEVEAMLMTENCTAETTVAFLRQLRAKYVQPLIIIWDNGPAHRGVPIRTYLTTPGLNLRLIPLPAYSPDFNADEAIWDWVREEVTANTCLGTKAKVREYVGQFFARLSERAVEAKQRCRTILQAQADALGQLALRLCPQTAHVDSTLASV